MNLVHTKLFYNMHIKRSRNCGQKSKADIKDVGLQFEKICNLLSRDAAHGASVCAGTAVQAGVLVDSVTAEIIVHSDSASGAGIAASTASDAAVVDNIHWFGPPCLMVQS